MNNNIIEALKWRYATKKYNADKKISSEDLNTLKEVLKLAPSSNGIQPYKFLFIENPEIRKQLQAAAYNQSQVVDADQLVVLCSYKEYNEEHAKEYVKLNGASRGLNEEMNQNYFNYLSATTLNRPLELQDLNHQKQCYIALGMLLSAAAELKIDSTPMEGFNPDEFDKILGLDNTNFKSVVVCALGYRSESDVNASLAKVRKTQEEIIEVI